MENRALLAVVVSLLILLVYQAFLLPYFYPNLSDGRPPAEQGIEAETQAPLLPTDEVAAQPEAAIKAQTEPAAPEQLVTVDTDRFVAVLTSVGGRIKSFQLKDYRTTVDPNSSYQELIVPTADHELPLGVELRGRGKAAGAAQGQSQVITLRDSGAAYAVEGARELRLSGPESGQVSLVWQSPQGKVRKTFEFFGNRYDFGTTVDIAAAPDLYSEAAITWEVPAEGKVHGSAEKLFDQTVFLADGKFVADLFASSPLVEGKFIPAPGQDAVDLAWAGLSGRHFLAALVPLDAENSRLWLKERDATVEAKLLLPLTSGKLEEKLATYIGPKDVDLLESVGHKLERSVDLGYFSFIGFPLLWALRQSHTFTGNYGLDIILLTVVIKILFMPLTHKSFQTMKAMQKLQPQMAKLREQYKDDQENLNKEMMELYRRHKVNPFGGCVPMILQIPVFIGLYQALMNAVELRHAPFLLWIDDLSAPDRLGSIQLPFVEQAGIPVLTVLMGVSMLAQQWMTPPAGDPAQQRVMMLMPLLFTFMFVNFPAGLVLYWLVNNVLTIAQQYYTSRAPAAA